MFKRARLPIGISSFPDLRKAGKIYIDKTALIGELAEGFSYVFLSRPRRFGKSLLVSTLASLFEHGLRDFKGLAIEKTWQEKTYPVVKLDFSFLKGKNSAADFESALADHLLTRFSSIGFQYDKSSQVNFMEQLGSFLENPSCGQFVLLIDEYDAPLTACLNDPVLFEAIRNVIAGFFSRIKGASGSLRFLFITGITKYRQVSIFSELNNLTDISLDPQFGELLGYTRKEIEASFPEFLDNAVQSLNEETGVTYTRESLMDEMVANYDGFCFDRKASTHVFAPWSVLNFLSGPHNGFEKYWISSGGVSTWFTQWISQHGLIDAKRFARPVDIEVDQMNSASTPSEIAPEVLLFQTGYLSIVDSCLPTLTLGYPNREVASAMAKLYFNQFVDNKPVALSGIIKVLRGNDVKAIVENLNSVFLKIPYDKYPVQDESAVRGIALSYVMGAGLPVNAEEHNALGRSDLETTVGDTHWAIEFKYVKKDGEAEKALVEAIDQIREKRYGETTAAKKLIRLGMVYSAESRRIEAWKKYEDFSRKKGDANQAG